MIILFLFTSVLASNDWPSVRCASLDSPICYQHDQTSNEILIDECNQGSTWSITERFTETNRNNLIFSDSVFHCRQSETNSYSGIPGSLCTSNTQCKSSQCQDGRCQGKETYQPCLQASECHVGLTCRGPESTWNYQLAIGQSCVEDTDCMNIAGCLNGICTRYFSQLNGKQIHGGDNAAAMCSSGYIDFNTQTCGAAIKNKSKAYERCYNNSDCPTDTNATSKCECGLNEKGAAYCQALPGDEEYSNYIEAFKKVMRINTMCHTESAYTSQCPEIANSPDLEELTTSYILYKFRPSFIDPTVCVFSFAPYEIKLPDDDSSAEEQPTTVVIVVSAIGLALLILISCIWCIIIRKCIRPKVGNSEDQDMFHADLQMEVSRSNVVFQPQPQNINALEPAFKLDDLKVDNSNITQLNMGMPVAADANIGMSESFIIADPASLSASASFSCEYYSDAEMVVDTEEHSERHTHEATHVPPSSPRLVPPSSPRFTAANDHDE